MTTRPRYPEASRRHYRLSALLAQRAVTEAQKVASRGPGAVARVVVTHQIGQARRSDLAVPAILAEQGINSPPDAALNLTTFTTEPDRIVSMLAETPDLARLVASLVQDVGRATESVATAIRPDIAHVRQLTSPSCSRCAVLAGRVYRWSEGFQRHPRCDCTMVPTSVPGSRSLVQDPVVLAKAGLVTGLSKADLKAVEDGADFNQVVNVRRPEAGLRESGRVLARRGRPTPEGIYRIASTRDEAVALLAQYGYVV